MKLKLHCKGIYQCLWKSFLVVQFALLILFSPVFASGAESYAQITKISLRMNDAVVGDVLKAIEGQSEFIFFYQDQQVDLNRKVSITAEEKNISEILDQLFKGTENVYAIRDRQIVIGKSQQQLNNSLAQSDRFMAETQQAKKKEISGTVRDSKGLSLPGATVFVKGTTVGMPTDKDGNFRFSVSADAKILVFSFVGMKSQEVAIGTKSVYNIVLEDESIGLGEMVVVGYGVQKKGSVVGAVDKIKPAELKLPTRTVSTSLAGRLAGIIAVQSSGEPGYDGATFWIRGINTFTGTTTPLVLVDGVERSIDGIDPDEIADFTILKDATATAIYGVRGANGVVLVTSKRGVVGKPSISFRMENGFTSPLQLSKFVDGPTYMNVQNEALQNMGSLPIFTQQQIERTASGYDPYYYPNVNWMDELIKPVSSSQHATLSISGGSEKVRYFVSAAYINQDGMYKASTENSFNSNVNLKRYNFRTNVDMNLTNSTTLSLSLAGSLENRNFPGVAASTIFSWMQAVPPVWYPARYPDPTKIPGYAYGVARSPQQLLAFSGYGTEYYSRVQSNMTVVQQLDFITKGLSARLMYSFDSNGSANIARTMSPRPYLIKPWSIDPNGDPVLLNAEGKYNYVDQEPSSASYSNYLTAALSSQNTSRNMYSEAQILYNRQFGVHSVGGLLLYNQGDNLSAADITLYGSIPSRKQGLAGRMNYAFNDKYMLEYNFGYNGSENYAKGKRLGFFPSYAIGWVPTKEPFMSFMLPVVDFMKIRFSNGEVGNDQVSNRFSYITRVQATSTNVGFGTNNGYGYGSGAGIDITYYGNPDATWETATKTDLGTEMHFLKNFTLNFDVFKEVRSNIWTALNKTPAIYGFSTLIPYANVGKMENKGFDGFVEYNRQVNKDFTIQFKGTFTYADNKILANGDAIPKYEYQSRIGRNVNASYGYVAEGLYIDQADIDHHPTQIFLGSSKPGDIRYKDVNMDGKIDNFDQIYIGNPTVPKMTYGFGSSMTYKAFDFSFLLQGATQISFMISPKAFGEVNRGNVFTFMNESHWSSENQNLNADFPRLGVGPQNNNYVASTFWLRDGSYLRLKQTELGYTLPDRILKKIHAKNMRIYVNGLNLLTFSPFKWWDAESKNANGIYYPIQRVVNIGVDLKF
jgi:TonB-linked SusC/RagA family outer membrane protein